MSALQDMPVNMLAESLKQYISLPENRRTIDYGRMTENARVVCMGDTHVGWAMKAEFVRAVPALASCGFTHVALELLTTDF